MRRGIRHLRVWLATLALVVGVERGGVAQDATTLDVGLVERLAAVDAPAAGQIEAWIAQLDNNRYRVREEATQHLLQAVRDGNSASLGPLLAAANGGRPEQEDRAVWILRNLIDVEDLELRQQVLQHLIQVKDRPQVLAEAAEALAEIRHEFAVREIERLGGKLQEAGGDSQWQQVLPRRVIFAEEWRGGDDGLKLCGDLREVPLVIIVGTDVTGDGVVLAASNGAVQQLRLYGTQLTDADVAKLRERLPGVEIDYRRGGFLGVIGATNRDTAMVQSVQPNTAAAAAGLQPADEIRKFNGLAVNNFESLTREIAKHRPGEEVTLEIVRNGTPQEVKVKLGKWQSP